ncbi:hypothetical protein Cfor_01695, partial [Coptotermes formosanus]
MIFQKLLQPLTHILQVPGKQIGPKFAHTFNYWLKVPENKRIMVRDIAGMFRYAFILMDDIQDNSTLRRSIPAAHTIYGVASTTSAANCLILRGLKIAQSLNHPEAMKVCTERLLQMYWGQGLEIYWRDNYICPSFEEYKEMAKRKAGEYIMCEVAPLQLLSDNKVDFTRLAGILGQYFQIRDDYCNLCMEQ